MQPIVALWSALTILLTASLSWAAPPQRDLVPMPKVVAGSVSIGGEYLALITGQDGAPMVLVPAGAFLYGNDSERNKQRLTLPAFYMDVYEVTTRGATAPSSRRPG